MRNFKRKHIENILGGDKKIINAVVNILLDIEYDPKKSYSRIELNNFRKRLDLFSIPVQFKRRRCFGYSYERDRMEALILDMLL